jgi:hypothetical protein
MAEENGKVPALAPDLLAKMIAGIAKSQVGSRASMGGATLLRLLTSGSWVFGQGNDEVQQNSKWFVVTPSLKHGHCVWHESQLVVETMVDMWVDAPAMPASHPTGSPYKEQLSVELKCMTGSDKGQQVLYKTTSLGGLNAMTELKEVIRKRVEDDKEQVYVFPVLTLSSGSYPNKRHGGITHYPTFNYVGWADINGAMEGAAPTGAPKEEAAAPPKKPKKPPLPDEDTVAADAAEPPPKANGQRRRPGAAA